MSVSLDPATCQQALDGVGSGVAASLYAVDCAATATAQAAFGRLFGTDGALLPVLTILLTLFVAFFAFALITGRSNLGIASLTPRMMTLGLVLTFATSWIAYQGVVWNLAVGAPDQIASLLMGTRGSATQLFAGRIDIVFSALMEADNARNAGGAGAAAVSTFSPPGLMWLGATLLLLGTVGILATTRIALAVLLALGPVFVVLALFPATRGLFTGWLKGVIMLALAPLFAVLCGTLMLELSVPVLRTLIEAPNGEIDPRAAMAFFVIGAVHLSLMIMALKVAGTMVAGWTVFGLAGSSKETSGGSTMSSGRMPPAAQAIAPAAQAAAAAPPPSREIRLSATTPVAANDTAGVAGGTSHETRIVGSSTMTAPQAAASSANASLSRARGVGSRFRAAPNKMPETFR
ncbi:type IV secretion system protein [Altererythrobacter sp. Root672]|uniref:type IV secretion system protein n=1 Tax=Altererythrobacter sp. Root672 TaxID=1736584 RepID=UPI000A74FEC1|nr:type IV secretion system protein [Altererythrobacter sp. Root672]